MWRALRQKFTAAFPEPSYSAAATQQWSIVTFDIPESMKKKREWLRFALKRLGFTMLHKSVWIGKVTLPVEFLNDLDSLGLLPYVHILAVTKAGSLKHLNSFSSVV
jgi:DNA-binding transcriptional regulator PaaX